MNDAYPVVTYSSSKVYALIFISMIVSIILLITGIIISVLALAVGAGFGLAICFGLLSSFKRDMKSEMVVLTVKDGMLTGSALRNDLPISTTRFRVEYDNQGSWIIRLQTQEGKRVILSPGGWVVNGKSVRKNSACELMLQLGLQEIDQ